MELLSKKSQPEIWYEELSAPYKPEEFPNDKRYCCILFVNDWKIQEKDRDALSEEIANGNCSRVFFCGRGVDVWRESIQCAYHPTSAPEEDNVIEIDTNNYLEPQKAISAALNYMDSSEEEYLLILFIGKNIPLKKSIRAFIDHIGKTS